MARHLRCMQLGESLRTGLDTAMWDLPTLQLRAEQTTIDLEIVDDEHAHGRQTLQRRTSVLSRFESRGRGQGEPEFRAASGLAHEIDSSAHQLDQPARNHQTQSRAAELARGRAIRL